MFGIDQADAYHADLAALFETLSANPRMARMRSELAPPVRVHRHGAHVVIYLIENESDVLIVRVRHSREDWMTDPTGGEE